MIKYEPMPATADRPAYGIVESSIGHVRCWTVKGGMHAGWPFYTKRAAVKHCAALNAEREARDAKA